MVMALNNANASWILAVIVVVFNTKCSSVNLCPNTPCLCTNTTTDCSDRNLESLHRLENHIYITVPMEDEGDIRDLWTEVLKNMMVLLHIIRMTGSG